MNVSLLTQEEYEMYFWQKYDSGLWYILLTNDYDVHFEVFDDIEKLHYSGKANKDFELISFCPPMLVMAFLRKSRISKTDLATHLGMQVKQLRGKDLWFLHSDPIAVAETKKYFAEFARKGAH